MFPVHTSLYVVDGVPVDGIRDVNPNDIESIQVLKDSLKNAEKRIEATVVGDPVPRDDPGGWPPPSGRGAVTCPLCFDTTAS